MGNTNRRESLRLNFEFGFKAVPIDAPLSVTELQNCLDMPPVSRLSAEMDPINEALHLRISDLKIAEPRLADISQRLSEKIDVLVSCLTANSSPAHFPKVPVSLSVESVGWESLENYPEGQWLAIGLNPMDMLVATNACIIRRQDQQNAWQVAKFKHPTPAVDRQISRWVMKNTTNH